MLKSILLWNCSTYPSHVSDQHHHTVGFCSCLCRAYWFRWWKFIGFDAMKSSPLQHGCVKVIFGLQRGPPPEKQETTTWKATLWTFHSILVLQKRTHHIKYPSFPTIIFFRFLPPLLLYNLPPPPKKKEPPQKNTFFRAPILQLKFGGGIKKEHLFQSTRHQQFPKDQRPAPKRLSGISAFLQAQQLIMCTQHRTWNAAPGLMTHGFVVKRPVVGMLAPWWNNISN